MFRCIPIGFSIGLSLCVLTMLGVSGETGGKKVAAALNFKMAGLDGKEIDLAKFQGSVVLIVNVASECGYTPQYKSLQALYAKHAKKGLVILGVPCNHSLAGKSLAPTRKSPSSAKRTTA